MLITPSISLIPFQQYYRLRKSWLEFAYGAYINEGWSGDEESELYHHPSSRKVIEISDMIRYLSEFL
jgi:hypothetical protein